METKFIILVGEIHLADEVRNLVHGFLREAKSTYKFFQIKPDLYKALIIVPKDHYQKLLLNLSDLIMEESKMIIINEFGDALGTATLGLSPGYVELTKAVNIEFPRESLCIRGMFEFEQDQCGLSSA